MTRPADTVVREAVHDLAGEARMMPDLAVAALTQGRRIRRRRRATIAVAAVLAMAATATPYLLLRSEPTAPAQLELLAPSPTPPETPAAATATNWTERPFALPGGWVVTGATSTGSPARAGLALDRDRERYVRTGEYDETWAAPRGSRAAVVDYDRRGRIGLLDLGTGEVRWVDSGDHILNPEWSPDGAQLLLTVLDKASGVFSFTIVDARTGEVARHRYDEARYECTDRCQFTWTPDGKEVALPQTDPDAPRSEAFPHARRGIQLFSAADGVPTRLVPVRGDVAWASSWSPDGTSVVVKGQKSAELVDVATGRVVRVFPTDTVHWVDGKRLLYVAEGEAVLLDTAGERLEHAALPDELLDYPYVTVAPR